MSHARSPIAVAMVLLLCVLASAALPSGVAAATTFVVNKIGDAADLNLANSICDTSTNSGRQCTLRAAIQEANDTPGADTIEFNITSASKTITPASPLPTITGGITINGYSQAGAGVNTQANADNAVLKIVLDGSGAGTGVDGLVVQASNSVIRGLVIQNFDGNGILVTGNSNAIRGNFIGTNAAGTAAAPNAQGVKVTGSDNTIGGTTPAVRNLISGSDPNNGIELRDAGATGNLVQGNFIGTNAAGTDAIPNEAAGVETLNAPNNTIGGTAAGARNVISGGVVIIQSTGDSLARIQGNFIGTNAAGTAALPNATHGVSGVTIVASAVTVGGTNPNARNVISGNTAHGVLVSSFDETQPRTGVVIQGNYIGLNAAGSSAIGNASSGVQIRGAHGAQVGGTTVAARNVISGNGNAGVLLFGDNTDGNFVQGNFIGTKADGSGALGNGNDGVLIFSGADDNLIGGTTPGAGNRINANGQNGVQIFDQGSDPTGATGNKIQGNGIAANAEAGVGVAEGPTDVSHNVIVQNGGDGVAVEQTASGVSVRLNQLISNTGLAIDLEGGTENAFGVTSNDTGDPDSGPNSLQNFPVLGSAVRFSNGETIVSGSLNSAGSRQYRIDLYVAVPDPSGHGEVLQPVGSQLITTNSAGNRGFSFSTTLLSPPQQVTATATRVTTASTSEFSTNIAVIQAP